MITQAQYTITALHDGADALVLSVSSDAGTIAKNAPLDATLSARVSRGGRELTAEEIAALGVVDWYRDGSDFAAARGLSLPVSAAAAAAWEARLEQPDPALSGPSVSFSAAAPHPLKELLADLVPEQDLHGYDGPWIGGGGNNQYDPDSAPFEQGAILGSNGKNVSATSTYNAYRIRTNGLIDVGAGKSYTISANLPLVYLCYLGANGLDEFIGNSGGWHETPYTFTTPVNTAKLRLMLTKSEDITGASAVMVTPEDFAWLQIEQGEAATACVPYENLCPITGHEGLTLMRTAAGAETAWPVAFPAEAGTVGSGSLDLLTGRLTVTGLILSLTGEESGWAAVGSGANRFFRLVPGFSLQTSGRKCSHLRNGNVWSTTTARGFYCYTNTRPHYFSFRPDLARIPDLEAWKDWLREQNAAGTPLQVYARLDEPREYALPPLSLYAAAGENVFSAGGEELTLIPSSRILARGSLGLAAVYDGERGLQGPPGADGRSSYLHVKYSDDGAHFTGRNGEDLGLFIGTLVDFEEQDSTDFSAYTWRRFADDTELMGYVDDKEEKLYETLRGRYVAVSDFGSYTRDSQAIIEANSRGVEELYRQTESLESAARQTGESLSAFTQLMEGQLRRGFLTDPDTGETVFGIAVSQRLNFTGAERTEGGERYYELSDQGAFGLYTATGWQYWINGRKVGWFQSGDSRLHLRSLQAEEEISLSAWRLSSAGGLGLRV